MITDKEMLTQVRGLIEKGWIKGQFVNKERYCIMGALQEVANKNDIPNFMSAKNLLTRSLPAGMTCLTVFNDLTTTKLEDVLALIDRSLAT